ncbi:MAG TPA: FtsX-like permease family protein, partial [Bacteroidota bacterium]
VVTQFAISLILISGTIVFFQQIRFMNSKELGFSKEQVITFRISDGRTIESLPRLHSELSRIPGVMQASAASRPPVNISSGYSIRKEGVADRGGLIVSAMPVDHRFIQTLSITVIAGSGLHEVNPTDTAWYFVLNESAVRALDWTPEVAVGKSLLMSGRRKGVVTGVMKDFNIKSLHTPLEPFVLFNSREAGYTRDIGYLLVKLAPQSLPRVLGELEKVWREMVPHRPFQFTFLDEELDALYRSEQRLGTLVAVFAGFAVVIACLGLFALTAFTAEQRTKEIGVRKVLGATVSAIVALLSKDFLALVAIGFLVGAPVSYIGLSEWLQNFAYRIDLGYEYFLLAGVTMLVIALATVSFQAIRAALANPVEALRYE